MIDHTENLAVGDLVKFWDYEDGGHVIGVIVGMVDYKYCHDKSALPSINVLCGNNIQTIPLDDEWVSLVSPLV